MAACSTVYTARHENLDIVPHRVLIGFRANPNSSTNSLSSDSSAVSTAAVRDFPLLPWRQNDVVDMQPQQRKQSEGQCPTYYCEDSDCNQTFHDQALWRQHIGEHFVRAYPNYANIAMASESP
jgi:hypothetical protein